MVCSLNVIKSQCHKHFSQKNLNHKKIRNKNITLKKTKNFVLVKGNEIIVPPSKPVKTATKTKMRIILSTISTKLNAF